MPGKQALKIYFEEFIFKPTAAQLIDTNPVVYPMFNIPAGTRVIQVDEYITTGFDGTAPEITVGDGVDPDGFITAAGHAEANAGINAGTGAYHAANAFGKLYTAADTVDITFTGSANATVGASRYVAMLCRVF